MTDSFDGLMKDLEEMVLELWAERSVLDDGFVRLEEIDQGMAKRGYDFETGELAKAVTLLAHQLGWQVTRPFDPELRVQPFA